MPRLRPSVPVVFALLLPFAGCGDSTGPAVHDPSRLTTTVPSGTPGVATEVVVEARDTEGRPFTGELPGLAMAVRGANAGAATSASEAGEGAHVLTYTPTELGMDSLDVTLDGEPVPASPFVSRVRIVFEAAVGSPTVDGTLAPGEWDAATAYPIFAGAHAGSTARFLVDGTDLYVLLRVPVPAGTELGTGSVRFDNTLDLELSGDDVIGAPPSGFFDGHFEESLRPDLEDDGSSGRGIQGTEGIVELRHPLSSGDPEDIDVARGGSVGVCLRYNSELTSTSNETSHPAGCILTSSAQRTYAELLLPPA
ncbi:MAG: hypothetical protein PVI57_24140 [Gemmatimonadota bacterium]|jgi:hypothetical protein